MGKGCHRKGEAETAALAGGNSTLGVGGVQPCQGDHLANGGEHDACECGISNSTCVREKGLVGS